MHWTREGAKSWCIVLDWQSISQSETDRRSDFWQDGLSKLLSIRLISGLLDMTVWYTVHKGFLKIQINYNYSMLSATNLAALRHLVLPSHPDFLFHLEKMYLSRVDC